MSLQTHPVAGAAPSTRPAQAGLAGLLARIDAFFSVPSGPLPAENVDVYAFTNWCMALALCSHASFAALFFGLGVLPMAAFNLGSTALFAGCLVIARRGRSHTAMGLAVAEVAVHAVLATLYAGVSAGFHYHMVLIVGVAPLFASVPAAARLGGLLIVGLTYAAVVAGLSDRPGWAPLEPGTVHGLALLNVGVFTTTLAGIGWYYTRAMHEARAQVAREYQRSEALLHNILPRSVVRRLKDRPTIADRFESCSVMFADMAGFTAWSARVEPEELVEQLNAVFSAFDQLVERHGLEKIKTIGDAYMAAAGVPEPRTDHAEATAELALDMREYMRARRAGAGGGLTIRIGIHSGPAVAGVIGLRRSLYDLWGDTVNTAARMESHGVSDEIQVSQDTAALLAERYLLQDRGLQQIKGKGPMRTFLLLGRRPAPATG
jgi:adenylate cyclase